MGFLWCGLTLDHFWQRWLQVVRVFFFVHRQRGVFGADMAHLVIGQASWPTCHTKVHKAVSCSDLSPWFLVCIRVVFMILTHYVSQNPKRCPPKQFCLDYGALLRSYSTCDLSMMLQVCVVVSTGNWTQTCNALCRKEGDICCYI